MGRYASLALDGTGNPHISYYDSIHADLKYARRNGLAWLIQTVDTAGNVGQYGFLALDSAGLPHISYSDETGDDVYDLKYARWDGIAWLTQTVDSSGDVGQSTSLALDAAGHPHISYTWIDFYLRYAWWDGGAWHTQIVDSAGRVGDPSSLALDAAGDPHISYFDGVNGDLKYARWDGNTWLIQVVDSVDWQSESSSLALDGVGLPHISYYDGINGDLKYARWDGNTWLIQVVDSEGDVGEYSSLALDNAGFPHISYYDGTNGGLKYARWDGSAWLIQTIDSAGQVGQYSSLALDSAGLPHISYYDSYPNFSLKYAQVTFSTPETVAIVGPELGYVNAPYAFAAATSPITATAPLTYTWMPEPDGGQGTSVVTYTWNTPGFKSITTMAAYAGGMVTDTHTILVRAPVSPTRVLITGPTTGEACTAYTFTATVTSTLGAAFIPLTFIWEASGQNNPVTHTFGGMTDTVTFNWTEVGNWAITVTATNLAGSVSDVHSIVLGTRIYLPVVLRGM